jgi:beta-glucosidase/6-phospho-beta-glucosidase/beta-galactosidase
VARIRSRLASSIFAFQKNHALYNARCVQVVPWGFRKLLNWVKNEYGDIPIFITENGYADNGEVDDVDRVEYYRVFFYKTLKSFNAA